MVSKFGYCPFGEDAALKKMANAVIEAHNSQHRFFSRFHSALLIPVEGQKVLSVVGIDQQLYIFAHGAIGDNRVHSAAAADHAAMDVTDLAKQLKVQGLSLAIKKIKMWVCNSGRQNTDGHSTAEYFKSAMRGQGFNAVTVYGYSLSLLDHVDKKGSKVGASVAGEERVAKIKIDYDKARALETASKQLTREQEAFELDLEEGLLSREERLDELISTRPRGGLAARAVAEQPDGHLRPAEKIPARNVRTVHSGPAPIVSPPRPVR